VSKSLRCRIAGCPRDVAPPLSVQGVCVGHYLALVVPRLDDAFDLCQAGKYVEPGAFHWLLMQGDFAARALEQGGGATDPLERTRLLELLLCLANLHEYARHHSVEPPPPASVPEPPPLGDTRAI
jgi:hypothetical protein